MEALLLVTGAFVFPLLWGYLVSWGMQRFWPRKRPVPAPLSAVAANESRLVDYQI